MNKNLPTVDVTNIKSTYKLVNLDDITYMSPGDMDSLQSREFYGTEEEIESLKVSITAKGLLESPIVQEKDDGSGYRVLEGNRRCHVLNLLVDSGVVATDTGKALTKVRVEVKPSILQVVEATFSDWFSLNPDASEEEQTECREYLTQEYDLELGQEACIRNTQRLNWNPVEVARQTKRQLDAGKSIEELAKVFDLAVQTLKTRLSLLDKEGDMPQVVKAVEQEEVSFSVGKLLANVSDGEARKEILEVAKGVKEDGEKPSTQEVKEIIDTKHKESKDSGGEGIKTQDRKKRAKKAPKTAVRSSESILETIQGLSATRAELQADKDNTVSENAALDLGVAIQVLQWVVDPSDENPLETVILGVTS